MGSSLEIRMLARNGVRLRRRPLSAAKGKSFRAIRADNMIANIWCAGAVDRSKRV